MPDDQESWLPVRAALHPDGLYLALRRIAPAELLDAFLHETIARVSAPETVVQISRGDAGRAAPDSAPAGLIFHVARCGSTVISQSLRQLPDLVVYAEPLPVNEILLPPHKWPRRELIGALRSLGDALARHARKPYVLKFSSWNTLFCDILAEAFPAAPWVLSLRDPVEVGVSLLEQPPGWLRESEEPHRQLFPYLDPAGDSKTPEEKAARAYGAFCEAAARLDAERGRLIAYETLPASAWEIVAPHFSLAIDGSQRARMAEAARSHSKSPIGKATAFVSDSARKQAAASTELRRAIDAFAQPSLDRLKALFRRESAVP